MKALIIIPAYNEQDNIQRVVDNLIKNYPQYSYVIINDGSKDNTAAICRENGYHMIDLPVNLGLAGAFQEGMKYAARYDYDYAVQFDADGQHRPEYIASMLEEAQKGNDIVIGSRFVDKKKPISFRMLGSAMISTSILLTTRRRIKDPTSGMRMYNKRMIKAFSRETNLSPEPDSVAFMLKSGAKVKEVPVIMDERIAGASYLTLSKSLFYMLRMTVSILFIQIFRKPMFPKNKQ